jgi:hypothetical protein
MVAVGAERQLVDARRLVRQQGAIEVREAGAAA